ncbi:MAG: hypothetical protein MZU95_01385 [Desulfomicrobium escambiense]|nr:hypothetical protein [Desulfomicrobium escambiense]
MINLNLHEGAGLWPRYCWSISARPTGTVSWPKSTMSTRDRPAGRTGLDEPLDLVRRARRSSSTRSAAKPRPAAPTFTPRSHGSLLERVREGARVVCFIGGGETFQLTNIVGPLDGLQIKDSARADAVVFNPRALFHVPFERFRPYIANAFRLLPETFGDGDLGDGIVRERQVRVPGQDDRRRARGHGRPERARASSCSCPRSGRRTSRSSITSSRISCRSRPSLPARPGAGWLEGEDYVFPELKALVAKRDEEKKKLEETLADYDRQIKDLKAGGQEEFHRLLSGEGAVLKNAVVHALRYLGWGRVVDVDQYWKNTIRNKEEDAWVIDPADMPVEAGLRKGELVIVLARGGKNWATDDECALLQKFKGRRMQEFDNTRMKAVLVGNYFSAAEAKSRPNPFSAAQIEEAQKDGNGLVTTYELFRAIKAEKEGRVSKDAIREQIRRKTGLITFDI